MNTPSPKYTQDTVTGPLKHVLDEWAHRYDLTPSEVDIFARACTEDIFATAPLTELAKGRGVVMSTVKKQVQCALKKTGDRMLGYAAVRILQTAYANACALPRPRSLHADRSSHLGEGDRADEPRARLQVGAPVVVAKPDLSEKTIAKALTQPGSAMKPAVGFEEVDAGTQHLLASVRY